MKLTRLRCRKESCLKRCLLVHAFVYDGVWLVESTVSMRAVHRSRLDGTFLDPKSHDRSAASWLRFPDSIQCGVFRQPLLQIEGGLDRVRMLPQVF